MNKLLVAITVSAAALLMAEPASSQQRYPGPYYGNGCGNCGYNNGAWGNGAYNSAIAVTGIAAGASVLNTLITTMNQPRVVVQQQPVVVQQAPTVVVQQQPVVIPQPLAGMATSGGCIQRAIGMDPSGRTVYTMVCQ